MTLHDLFLKYSTPEMGGTDGATLHSYGPLFDRLLEPYQHTADRVLEVGVRLGGSMRVWRDYFSKARIYGIDNGHEAGMWTVPEAERDRIEVAYADTFKPQTVFDRMADWCRLDFNRDNPVPEMWYQPFDVIIDDGCHNVLAQAATWAMLWPYLRSGGCYLLTDVEGITHAQNLQRHFGGTIEDRRMIKNRHDDICLVWVKE